MGGARDSGTKRGQEVGSSLGGSDREVRGYWTGRGRSGASRVGPGRTTWPVPVRTVTNAPSPPVGTSLDTQNPSALRRSFLPSTELPRLPSSEPPAYGRCTGPHRSSVQTSVSPSDPRAETAACEPTRRSTDTPEPCKGKDSGSETRRVTLSCRGPIFLPHTPTSDPTRDLCTPGVHPPHQRPRPTPDPKTLPARPSSSSGVGSE